MKKVNTKQFTERAKLKFGDRYDYQDTVYKSMLEEVDIICHQHGLFQTTPYSHLNSMVGCKECGAEVATQKRIERGKKTFIEKMSLIYGNRYQFHYDSYRGVLHPIKFICNQHGKMSQIAATLLRGRGCPKCILVNKRESGAFVLKKFIARANVVHGNRYDYSNLNWKGWHKQITLTCPEHGLFTTWPQTHIQGSDCRQCWCEGLVATKKADRI